MGLSRTVSEINVNFGRKIFPPRVVNAPDKGFTLEFYNGVGAQKTRMLPLLDVGKYDDMRMRLDTIPALKVKGQTDGQTDGRN